MSRNLVFGLSCLLLANAATANEWRLLDREGCVAVGPKLAARAPEAAGVGDPAALVRLMRDQGRAVVREDEYLFCGRRVKVRVPSLKLALTFSESDACDCAVW